MASLAYATIARRPAQLATLQFGIIVGFPPPTCIEKENPAEAGLS